MSEERIFNSFANLLASHADGDINAQLSDGIQEMVAALSNKAVERGGKHKGKIVLTVDIELDQGVFGVTMDASIKMPKKGGAKAVYWATDKNKLTPSNPKQVNMFTPARTAAIEASPEAKVVG